MPPRSGRGGRETASRRHLKEATSPAAPRALHWVSRPAARCDVGRGGRVPGPGCPPAVPLTAARSFAAGPAPPRRPSPARARPRRGQHTRSPNPAGSSCGQTPAGGCGTRPPPWRPEFQPPNSKAGERDWRCSGSDGKKLHPTLHPHQIIPRAPGSEARAPPQGLALFGPTLSRDTTHPESGNPEVLRTRVGNVTYSSARVLRPPTEPLSGVRGCAEECTGRDPPEDLEKGKEAGGPETMAAVVTVCSGLGRKKLTHWVTSAVGLTDPGTHRGKVSMMALQLLAWP